MDIFLSKVTQQAMNYAIRSGVSITATYALRQSARLLKTVKSSQREELMKLQERLHQKIKIIAPAIDMIELISARGNTSLESALSLTKEVRWEIQSLGQRLAKAASDEETARGGSSSTKTQAQTEIELKLIAQDIQKLLDRIEDAVPLINLAITTSGASLSAGLPSTVSPSRLLQASTFLTAADTQYCMNPMQPITVGPIFILSVYMLFEAHIRGEGIRETTWKEVIHKARMKLRRTPIGEISTQKQANESAASTPLKSSSEAYFDHHMSGGARADEYAYQLMIVEDFDDDRMHDFDDIEAKPGKFDDVDLAGIREVIPVHQISKIFYADTGKMLNISTDGDTNNPVLLLKRDINAIPPRRMMERSQGAENDGHNGTDAVTSPGITSSPGYGPKEERPDKPEKPSDPWRFPPGLDPEWIAFEVYEEDDSDEESESGTSAPWSRESSLSPSMAQAFSSLHLGNNPDSSPSPLPRNELMSRSSPGPVYQSPQLDTSAAVFNSIRTSLSLLEVLLRLTSLQQFQQQSHLSINDELLNFFLEESSATGAGGDEDHRRQLRTEARRRVGWDPYDESPIKRRGEEYQYQYHHEEGVEGWENEDAEWNGHMSGYDYDPNPRSSPFGPRSYHIRERSDTPLTPSMRPRNRPSGRTTPGSQQSRMSPQQPRSPAMQSDPTKGRDFYWRRQPDGVSLARKGSPLARPGTGVTDEGLGTSPGSPTGAGSPGKEVKKGK